MIRATMLTVFILGGLVAAPLTASAQGRYGDDRVGVGRYDREPDDRIRRDETRTGRGDYARGYRMGRDDARRGVRDDGRGFLGTPFGRGRERLEGRDD